MRRERERLQAQVDALIGRRGGEGGALTRAEYLALSNRGEALRGAGRAREAEQVFRALLSRLPPPPTGEGQGEGGAWAYERAVTLGRLGRTLSAQGRPVEAADLYRQELAALAHLGQSESVKRDDVKREDVKREAGVTHTDLADALTDLGRYAEARAEYEAALVIDREVGGDERGTAVTLGQLGTLALVQGDYAEARRRYQEGLAAFQTLGEPESEAVLWHQLGMVAQGQREWDGAEHCYRESVRLSEAGNNLAYAAGTANQLGAVCQGAGRSAEAETWYRRALDSFQALGDRRYEAACANNLAGLLLDVEARPPAARPAPFAARDLVGEAEAYAHRAREIREALNDPSSEVWKTYSTLAQIAERRGRPDEVRRWRRREQESFAAFRGADVEIREWLPLIPVIVAACEGSEEAKKQAEQHLQTFEEGWPTTVAAIHYILQGERDLDLLTADLARKGALIVRCILAALAGEEPSPPSPLSQQAGEGEELSPPSPLSRQAGEGEEPSPPASPRAGEGEEEGITLEQVFRLVEAGCRGDTQAGQLAYALVAQGLQAPAAPPELRALGKALQRILEGLRGEEALAGLPPELRPPVEELLRRVG